MKAYQQLNEYGKFTKVKRERRTSIEFHADARVDFHQTDIKPNGSKLIQRGKKRGWQYSDRSGTPSK